MPAETAAPLGIGQNIVNEGPVKKVDFKEALLKTRPLDPSQQAETNIPSALPKLPGKEKVKNYSKKTPLGNYDNEKDNQPNPNFSPMEIDPAIYPANPAALRESLQKSFDYHSRTGDLEIGTERTRRIEEDILGPSNKLKGIKTRVVIMRKGAEPNAFVYPDGTIFITQSLLNQMQNYDQLAYVLGHEVGHLINKSSYKIQEADGMLASRATKWVHESACDNFATDFAEDAKFNSMEGRRAIYGIAGTNRGDEHQSGLARSTQVIGKHGAIDSETSNLVLKPMPDMLKGEYRRTNLEIAQELAYPKGVKAGLLERFTGDREAGLRMVVEKLHPEDLDTFYRDLNLKWDFGGAERTALKVCNKIIMESLVKKGFSLDEAKVFILIQGDGSRGHNKSSYLFEQNIGELDKIAKTVSGLSTNRGRFEEMTKGVFGRLPAVNSDMPVDPKYRILTAIKDLLYDPNYGKKDLSLGYTNHGLFSRETYGITADEKSILKFIQDIAQIRSAYEGSDEGKNYLLNKGVTGVLQGYIDNGALEFATRRKENLKSEDMVRLFEKVKGLGFSLDTYLMERNYAEASTRQDSGTQLRAANKQVVLEAYKDVFFSEKITRENIDNFFKTLSLERQKTGYDDVDNAKLIAGFIDNCRQTFHRSANETPESLEAINYISNKIDGLDFNTNVDVRSALSNLSNFRVGYAGLIGGSGDTYRQYEEGEIRDQNFDREVLKFNLKMYVGLNLFRGDSESLYKYVTDAMRKIPGTDTLDSVQLVNLCQGLFQATNNSGSGKNSILFGKNEAVRIDDSVRCRITDYESLMKLPLMARIGELGLPVAGNNIEELAGNTQELLNRVCFAIGSDNKNLFSDNFVNVVVGKSIRQGFEEILSKGITENEYDSLFQFVSDYMPGSPEKGRLLRTINRKFLSSESVTIDQKTDYLVRSFDSIGPEGMLIVANQITDLETYKRFRGKVEGKIDDYTSGKGAVKGAYVGDLASSALASHFDDLLNTARADSRFKKESTTALAVSWFSTVFSPHVKASSIQPVLGYDKDKGRFILDDYRRPIFQSLKDVISSAKDLGPVSRFGLIFKALTEQGGAFSSPESRKKLAKSIKESLNMPAGYLDDVVTSACERGDASLMILPVAKMLSPLLFEGLDMNSVDISKVSKVEGARHLMDSTPGMVHAKVGDHFSEADISRVLNSSTRDLSFFGPQYRNQPDSLASRLTQESNLSYEQIETLLRGYFPEESSEKNKVLETPGVPAHIEAVIRGLEASNALAVRGLQLSNQFADYAEPIRQRTARSLDANAGMNKLVFWENLYKQAERDSSVAQQLERFTLGEYAGGGSMQTTYKGKYRLDSGEEISVVLKMKNPNAEAFVGETYKTAVDVLTPIANKKLGGKSAEYARTTLEVIDMARDWCLKDLADPTFAVDDDAFGQVIDSYNSQQGRDTFYKPERVYLHPKILIETEARGRTLNKVLNDPAVDPEIKKGLIIELDKFFAHQMKNDREERLIHSDPHAGNYMVTWEGGSPKIGVIDRHMYLKQKKEDVESLERLIKNGNDNDFVYGFIDRVIDLNRDKVTTVEAEYRIAQSAVSSIALEYGKQRISGNVNRQTLMTTMLRTLKKSGMTIPLELRLMVRNITATQEQSRRFGVDFESIYNQVA